MWSLKIVLNLCTKIPKGLISRTFLITVACNLFSSKATKIALMAVQYATDSNSVPSNLDRIDIILNDIGDGELRRLSLALEHLVIGLSHMKYPSSHDSPWIPGEVYCESHANEAYRLSKQILDRCAQIIERS